MSIALVAAHICTLLGKPQSHGCSESGIFSCDLGPAFPSASLSVEPAGEFALDGVLLVLAAPLEDHAAERSLTLLARNDYANGVTHPVAMAISPVDRQRLLFIVALDSAACEAPQEIIRYLADMAGLGDCLEPDHA